MEKFNATSSVDPDAPPPSYSSLIGSQYHQHLMRPLISPTTSYPMPAHAIYPMPKDQRRDDAKPNIKFGLNPTYALPLLRNPEVPVVSVIAATVHNETANVPSQRRSLISNSKKCCVIIVVLVVCGFWAVMSMNYYARHKTSHTF